MVETKLKEIGYRLTGLNIIFDKREWTILRWGTTNKFININHRELEDCSFELQDRGYTNRYIALQALLHEVAHYKQFLKYGKGIADIFEDYMKYNKRKAEDTADRYALMYYRRFVKVS